MVKRKLQGKKEIVRVIGKKKERECARKKESVQERKRVRKIEREGARMKESEQEKKRVSKKERE